MVYRCTYSDLCHHFLRGVPAEEAPRNSYDSQTVIQSVGHPVTQSIGHSVNQSVGHSTTQSVSQSVSRPIALSCHAVSFSLRSCPVLARTPKARSSTTTTTTTIIISLALYLLLPLRVKAKPRTGSEMSAATTSAKCVREPGRVIFVYFVLFMFIEFSV